MNDHQSSKRSWAGPACTLLAALLLLAACGPSGTAPSSGAGGAAPAARPAAGGAGAAPAAGPGTTAASERPEKDTLILGGTIGSSASIPLFVAQEAGYFGNHGINVEASLVSSTVGVQGVVSGSLDVYWGGATTMVARLGGADIVYVAAPVDRNTLLLVGEPGLTSFPMLRGKTVATTAAGAFSELAVLQTAKEYGMVAGQDFTIHYNPSSEVAYAAFTSGAAQAATLSSPWGPRLVEQGHPVIVDYYQRGLRIVGPGVSVQRDFARTHPNLLKAFLRGYLDGVKRAYDDPEYATAVYMRRARLEDQAQGAKEYEDAARVWNRDLTVDRGAIEVVLQNTPVPNAKEANPETFYDNSLINEVNATYAARLFPDVFTRR